jgi:hypothetical protein
MNNNPKIDGVSRELRALLERVVGKPTGKLNWDALDENRITAAEELRALLDSPVNELREHCKQCAEVVKTWPEWKQNCLGGAPAVERQEPAIQRFNTAVSHGGSYEHVVLEEHRSGHVMRSNDVIKYVTDLQPTIAQLRQHKNDYMEAAEETRRALTDEIAQLQARVQELESGRGEPVAVVTSVVSRKNKRFEIEILDNQKLHIGTWLFTAPPAPVSFVLPDRCIGAGFGRLDEYRQGWNACLDATAALNEERK